jgi:4-amino-4-deoxy-L-arabinose transferase-like glycosyltransferase
MLVVFPDEPEGAIRNLVVAAVLLINQGVAIFLTPAEQKRVIIPQMVLVLLMLAYVMTSAAGVIRHASAAALVSLLVVSFVPLILALLITRRANAR